jgi:hypothetical protein
MTKVTMKFTQREIELLSIIPVERAKRRRSLFLGFACWLAAPVIALYVDIDSPYDLTNTDFMLGGILAGQWGWDLHSRPEDKLIDRLRRYVKCR